MYMTWQVIFMNGQQKRTAISAILASLGEAFTTSATLPTTATIARAFAATAPLPTATTTAVFVHFYICRTGRLSRNLFI